VIVMKLHLCKRAIIGAFLAGATVMAGTSSKSVIESVKSMEREFGLAITEPGQLARHLRRSQQIPVNYNIFAPVISPDATAIAWWSRPHPYRGEEIPLVTVKSLKEGMQLVRVKGQVANGSLGVSFGAEVVVAIARRYPLDGSRWELLAIDRRSGVVVHDLTPFVTEFELGNNVEVVSVSGPGNLVALGSREPEQMQVLEIPSGKTVFTGPGRFPRLSPDAKRLAFIHNDKLMIHSFADGSGSMVQLLKGKRVKGVGGWSPDGRFLIAGAWTTSEWLALEKRQIIVDSTTGEYAVIGKLGEGDYGTNSAWVSVMLLEH